MSVKTAISRVSILLFVCILVACSQDKEAMISKKWKAVRIDNSTLRKQKEQYLQMLDTITAENEMVEFFGSVDSFKKVVLADVEAAEQQLKTNTENSFMEFKKNHVAYFISIDGIDSAKWHLEQDEIVLNPEEFTGTDEITRFKISHLSGDSLSLTMINQYDTSIISLKSASN